MILFLGPGRFASGAIDGVARRRRLARIHGGEVVIMEDEPDRPGEAVADKFLRLATAADEVMAWLPRDGRLPTVFAELAGLRFRPDHHGKRLTLFFQDGVLEATGKTFEVAVPEGQVVYLRDLRDVFDLRTWRYVSDEDLERLVHDHGRGLLEDA